MKNHDTVKEQFSNCFTQSSYDGSYHGADGFQTISSEEAARSFYELTGGVLSNWCQVHGDVKNPVNRADFVPYAHWSELYACCRDIIRSHVELNKGFFGDMTRARLMGDAMSLLNKRHCAKVPKWWLPIMKKLREEK